MEDHLAAVLRELETRATEDAERIVKEELARAARRRQWLVAMADAERKAYEGRDAVALYDQVTRWRQAQEIVRYCDALTQRLNDEPPGSPAIPQAQTGSPGRAPTPLH